MQYRKLGRTGLSVSSVGLGTWQLGGMWDKTFAQCEVDGLFRRAAELGINFIDTAECYGFEHLSERLIGNAIAGAREKWIIATKFGHNHANDLENDNYLPGQVQLQLEESLRALQTDVIDIYQIHSAGYKYFNNDELWTMLNKQVQAGKIRFLGNSVPLHAIPRQIPKSREYGIDVIQVPYNAISLEAEQTLFPLAREMDLGIIARSPLAMGFLSGKYREGHTFPKSDVRGMLLPQENVDRQIREAKEVLRNKPQDMDNVSWACAWCLRQSEISVVIPGAKSVRQLEMNAAAGNAGIQL